MSILRYSMIVGLVIGLPIADPPPASAQVDTLARFGGLDDAGGLVSFRPGAAAFSRDQIILSQGDGLYILGPNEPARRFSARGEGPGDVQLVRELAVFGDSILTFDMVQRRLTVFSDDTREASTTSFPDVAAWNEAAPLSDGSLVAFHYPDFERLVLSPKHKGTDVVVRPDSMFVQRREPGRDPVSLGVFSMSARYQTSAGTWFAPGHKRVFRSAEGDGVLLATSHSPEFVVINPVTGKRWNGSASVRARPLDPTLHDLLVEEFLNQEEANLGFTEPQATADAKRAVVRAAGRSRLAPLFDRAILAHSGEAWLRERREPGAELDTWRVVSRSAPERAVRIPSDFTILAIQADRIVASSRDEFDVATLFVLSVPQ